MSKKHLFVVLLLLIQGVVGVKRRMLSNQVGCAGVRRAVRLGLAPLHLYREIFY